MKVHEDTDVGDGYNGERNADTAQHEEQRVEVLVASVKDALQVQAFYVHKHIANVLLSKCFYTQHNIMFSEKSRQSVLSIY